MVAEESRGCREQAFDMWSDIQCDVGDEREEPSNQRTSTYSSRPTAVRTARASGQVRLISSLGHIMDDPSKGDPKLHVGLPCVLADGWHHADQAASLGLTEECGSQHRWPSLAEAADSIAAAVMVYNAVKLRDGIAQLVRAEAVGRAPILISFSRGLTALWPSVLPSLLTSGSEHVSS